MSAARDFISLCLAGDAAAVLTAVRTAKQQGRELPLHVALTAVAQRLDGGAASALQRVAVVLLSLGARSSALAARPEERDVLPLKVFAMQFDPSLRRFLHLRAACQHAAQRVAWAANNLRDTVTAAQRTEAARGSNIAARDHASFVRAAKDQLERAEAMAERAYTAACAAGLNDVAAALEPHVTPQLRRACAVYAPIDRTPASLGPALASLYI